jgi:hypothetical protein
MLLARLPDLAWKMLLSVMALLAVGLWILEAPEAIRTVRTGERGGLDISIEAPPQQWLSRDWVITRIGPESPLNALGVRVGCETSSSRTIVPFQAAQHLFQTLESVRVRGDGSPPVELRRSCRPALASRGQRRISHHEPDRFQLSLAQ